MELGALHEQFVSTATMYGKMIISERFLPDSKKTIKPSEMGGLAGGIKYEAEGILFKFAWDNGNIYGGDFKAMKAAAHGNTTTRFNTTPHLWTNAHTTTV